MTDSSHVEKARLVFAEVTGTLEDSALIAAEGQAAADFAGARHSCDRLLARLKSCLEQLQRLRRRLE